MVGLTKEVIQYLEDRAAPAVKEIESRNYLIGPNGFNKLIEPEPAPTIGVS